MTIFAVDDKKLPLDALTDAIRQAAPEATVYSFRSSSEALEYSRSVTCDVAIIDIQMPEINGVDLARQLKLEHPSINIIFATGYSEYTGVAMEMHCSGYLMKPITPEKIRTELEDLRYPVEPVRKNRLRIQTFGNFEVFLDGQPVKFRHDKTKEYLAYLVDRGTFCSNGEIMAALWEGNVSPSYIRLLRKDLMDMLKAAGCEDVIISQRNRQGLRTELIDCDFYDWKRGLPSALNAYRGEYMTQYSWAEITHGALE